MAPCMLAASTVVVVWLTIALVTLVAVIAMLVALIRHGLLIGRTVRRLNDEVSPITAEISSLAASAPRRVNAGRGSAARRP